MFLKTRESKAAPGSESKAIRGGSLRGEQLDAWVRRPAD
jgi:hypothetical protein